MVSVEESEKFGNLLDKLDNISSLIKDEIIKNKLIKIIEKFDEMIC